ncbi:MAG: DUF3127 domain-containing protein [Bacteroidales bacterium]|jgi:hypothetical protein|nr:DUF3127 domain-containing protein [Bacteroidales bacterium]
MSLDIKCKLGSKLPVQSGRSSRGDWSKEEFVVETLDRFPKKICMSVWGEDKVKELDGFKEGDLLSVSVNIESREYNGRWYTDVRAWKIQKDTDSGGDGNVQGQALPEGGDPFAGISDSDSEEDLPF